MNYIDYKYVNLLSSRLRNFKRKGPSNFNFSCPLCGDSETDTRKARGYIYDKQNNTYYTCHNQCGSMTFRSLIEQLDANLASQWKFERMVSEGKIKEPKREVDFSTETKLRLSSVSDADKCFKRLPTISSLPDTHEARRILHSRKIPATWLREFRYAAGFKEFTNEVLPGKFKNVRENEDGRIIIPFYSSKATNKKLFAYQGRSVSASEKQLRYITIVIDGDYPCLWGLDRIDLTKPIYVHEGVLDAIFIPNSLAIAGGNFASLQGLGVRENIVLVYDNEPRSIDTKKKMLQAITQGFKVVIWPNEFEEKDINAMVIAGKNPDYIHYILEKNTYEGIRAKATVTQWSKR